MTRNIRPNQRLYLLVLLFHTIYMLRIEAIHPKNTPNIGLIKSPCTFSEDIVYGGLIADCRGRSLKATPSDILPSNTTTLLLQGNNIHDLMKDAFINLPDLKCLKISNNGLRSIEAFTFQHNPKLISLDLEYNSISLDVKSQLFPGGVLENLHELIELRLASNQNSDVDCSGMYPSDLLMGLKSLRILSIDTFSCHLNFNSIFTNTTSLSSLTITGGVTHILNDSFHGFDSMKLKVLAMHSVDNLRLTESGAFQYLKDLDYLSLLGGRQGVKITLESLAPLANQSLVSLNLDDINDNDDISGRACNILTRDMTRYISQMCIQHIVLTRNGILYLEEDALSYGLLSHCLKSLDVSVNPLIGNKIALIGLTRLRVLQSFKFTNRKFSFFYRYRETENPPDYLQCLPRKGTIDTLRMPSIENRESESSFLYSGFTKSFLPAKVKDGENFTSNPSVKQMLESTSKLNYDLYANKLTRVEDGVLTEYYDMKMNRKGSNITVWIPENIKYINIDRFSNNIGTVDVNYIVKGGENLLEIHISDCGLHRLIGNVRGLENLQILDMSKNDVSEIAPRFFDSFPKLMKLDLSQTNIDNKWILAEGPSVFSKLTELISLDLSDNSLHFIFLNTFSTNTKLSTLGLAKNRFKRIPVDLNLQHNLCLLDLRNNSILQLDNTDINMLETHRQKMETFSLWLEGNVFSCACSNLYFLSWLQRTSIHLDNNRSYMCILENGNMTTTSQLPSLDGLWRECNGKVAFLISLIVASLMLLGYCLLFVGMQFETQLKAYYIKCVKKTLPLKQRSDYDYDVYIGYSDNDIILACQNLRHAIENRAGYRRTYLRHRDLIPASDMAESIVTAIDSSWRVVLVLTDQFLEEHWSFLVIKWAIHSIQDTNPDRLVLVFTSHQLPRHRILISLLKIVPESNIVYLTDTSDVHGLSPQEEQMVVDALCH